MVEHTQEMGSPFNRPNLKKYIYINLPSADIGFPFHSPKTIQINGI
jgi:hypothetical protein